MTILHQQFARTLTAVTVAIALSLTPVDGHAEAVKSARFSASGQSKLDVQGRKVYIVQLKGEGAMSGAAAKTSPRVVQKLSEFAVRQRDVIAKIGVGVEKIYSYRYAFNGFAARMSPAQAQRLRRHADVAAIWEDTVRKVTTNDSPEFLNLFAAAGGLIGEFGLRGEDIVIGVIDSGITPGHPSFADAERPPSPRLCRTSFGDNLLGKWLCRHFESRAPVLQYEPPGNWDGICQGGDQFAESDCNNKLIGARFFVAGALANQQIDENEIFSPRDADGHGTHIASTAAGNRVTARINDANVAPIQGMAPRARIAAYKACWLQPGDIRASCNTSDLAQAIDAAIADGVDIISYSIGNDMATVTSPDAIALLAAAKAGIFSAVAAGNEGPALGSIGSPASSPWVTTVAASSRTGDVFAEGIEIVAPTVIAGKIQSREANFTIQLIDSGMIEEDVVLIDDDDVTTDSATEDGTTDDGCQSFVNAADVADKIAFIRRSGCEFQVKIDEAIAAGASAVVVFSNTGAPVIMTSTSEATAGIPAVMIGQADGDELLTRLLDGETVRLRLANGLFVSETENGNFVGNFSGRGPATGAPDILKPDVSAPGINILAAMSPTQANGPKNVFYGYLTGTSMSTPHVAGVAALLKEAHPDWNPATLRSALMTSAYLDDVFREDNVKADAFDVGGGHIDPNRANAPGLVYTATEIDYDAFGCGLEEPIPDAARCDELTASGISTEPTQFNQASITIEKVTEPRIIERRVTNIGPATDWQVEVTPPPGFTIAVNPPTLSLGEGQTGTYQVAISQQAGQLDAWFFGDLTWVNGTTRVRTPITVKAASVDAPEEIKDAGGAGSADFPVKFGFSGAYTARVHGLVEPLSVDDFVANDPDKNFDQNGCEDSGVRCISHVVSPGQLYLRVALFDAFTDGDDDLDLFVFFCPQGLEGFCPEIGVSGEPTSEEEFNLIAPAAGDYIFLIHGFETDDVAGGPGANFSLFVWDLFGVDAAGDVVADERNNLSVTAPANVVSGSTETLTINWTALEPDFRYLGAISHGAPQGTVGLTIVNIRN